MVLFNHHYDKKVIFMKKRFLTQVCLVGLFSLLFFSCITDEDPIKGKFPTVPVNFEAVNSEYDDYNSASPYELYYEFPFVFSSNRKSQGGNFDFVNYIAYYYYNTSQKLFYLDVYEGSYWFLDSAMVKVNSDFNEYGPLFIDVDYSKVLLMYSNDSSGNLDLYDSLSSLGEWQSPKKINSVNSNYNEAYQCFNKSGTKMYFCSDSTGNFDIYYITLPESTPILNWIQSSEKLTWENHAASNSSADDKCPYINGNLMVFTSNREGGYGGYDLYYSIYENKTWSDPVNFGPEINSEYDEYRPLTAYVYDYKNDLMIFSSNRPGGLGGFDLYYVGIPKMTD